MLPAEVIEALGVEWPTMCLVGPRGGPALIGAVTLRQFALGVDPVTMRLVPIEAYLMASGSEAEAHGARVVVQAAVLDDEEQRTLRTLVVM